MLEHSREMKNKVLQLLICVNMNQFCFVDYLENLNTYLVEMINKQKELKAGIT